MAELADDGLDIPILTTPISKTVLLNTNILTNVIEKVSLNRYALPFKPLTPFIPNTGVILPKITTELTTPNQLNTAPLTANLNSDVLEQCIEDEDEDEDEDVPIPKPSLKKTSVKKLSNTNPPIPTQLTTEETSLYQYYLELKVKKIEQSATVNDRLYLNCIKTYFYYLKLFKTYSKNIYPREQFMKPVKTYKNYPPISERILSNIKECKTYMGDEYKNIISQLNELYVLLIGKTDTIFVPQIVRQKTDSVRGSLVTYTKKDSQTIQTEFTKDIKFAFDILTITYLSFETTHFIELKKNNTKCEVTRVPMNGMKYGLNYSPHRMSIEEEYMIQGNYTFDYLFDLIYRITPDTPGSEHPYILSNKILYIRILTYYLVTRFKILLLGLSEPDPKQKKPSKGGSRYRKTLRNIKKKYYKSIKKNSRYRTSNLRTSKNKV